MRATLLSTAILLAFAATPMASAQQTQGQDEQSDTDRSHQLTSANVSNPGALPEQAGDLYQARTSGNSGFGGSTGQPDPLPGALSSGTDTLTAGGPPDRRN